MRLAKTGRVQDFYVWINNIFKYYVDYSLFTYSYLSIISI